MTTTKGRTMTTKAITITTGRGIPFEVRIREKGDKWGRNNCLTWDKDEPVVEFHDLRTKQFVSDYYVTTLADHKDGCGLALWGNEPNWTIDAATMTTVHEFIKGWVK